MILNSSCFCHVSSDTLYVTNLLVFPSVLVYFINIFIIFIFVINIISSPGELNDIDSEDEFNETEELESDEGIFNISMDTKKTWEQREAIN